MSLCVAGGGLVVKLALASFTLAWTHSVEKVPWEEDWRVDRGALVLIQSRIKGSGAGMEPPQDARHIGGWYVWTPADPRRSRIVLRRVSGVPDWRLCAEDFPCLAIGALLPAAADPVTLEPC